MADEPEVSEAELADMISYYDRWKRDVLQRDLKKQLDEAAKQKEVLASWDKLEADVGQLLQVRGCASLAVVRALAGVCPWPSPSCSTPAVGLQVGRRLLIYPGPSCMCVVAVSAAATVRGAC